MKKKLALSVALALAVALTISSGVVHGYLDGRWTASDEVQRSAARLDDLPEQCGDWVRINEQPLAPAAAKLLRCHGYLHCDYWNSSTGDRVKVALLFGPRGPIAVHTPEICYSSAGTHPLGERAVETIETGGEQHQLWRIQFQGKDDPQPSLDVWYAWTAGGAWEAREHPRFWMANDLYKIQIAGVPARDGSGTPCRDFLAAFLPAVSEVIRTP